MFRYCTKKKGGSWQVYILKLLFSVWSLHVQVQYMIFLTSAGPVSLLGRFVIFSRSVSYTVYVSKHVYSPEGIVKFHVGNCALCVILGNQVLKYTSGITRFRFAMTLDHW
jgi:hypothetical protein